MEAVATVSNTSTNIDFFGVEIPVNNSQLIVSWDKMREIDDRIDELEYNLPLRLEYELRYSMHRLIADAWFNKNMTVDEFINRCKQIKTHIINMM